MHDRQPPRPRRRAGQRLAGAQGVESRDRKPLFGLDREAVRRAARRGAVMEGAARSAARPVAQFPVQPSGSRRRLDGHGRSPRLRRPSVLPARLFRVQDGAAVRLREVHARRRRRAAEVLRRGGTFRTRNRRARRRRRRSSRSARRPRLRGGGPFGIFRQAGAPPASAGSPGRRQAAATRGEAAGTAAAAGGTRAGVRPVSETDHRRRRPFRIRANAR